MVFLGLLSPPHPPQTVKGQGQQCFSCSLKSRCKSDHDFFNFLVKAIKSDDLSSPEVPTYCVAAFKLYLSCSDRFFFLPFTPSFPCKIVQVNSIYIEFLLNLPSGEPISIPPESLGGQILIIFFLRLSQIFICYGNIKSF